MTSQQTPPVTKIKKHTSRENGMVRVEFYLTVEERAILQTVCKQRGYSAAGFMYMLQRKAVAQVQQEEISTQIAILNTQYKALNQIERNSEYGIELVNKLKVLTKSR